MALNEYEEILRSHYGLNKSYEYYFCLLGELTDQEKLDIEDWFDESYSGYDKPIRARITFGSKHSHFFCRTKAEAVLFKLKFG